MAMRGILRGLGGKAGSSAHARTDSGSEADKPIAMADGASRLQLLDEFEAGGIGWFWATVAQGRFIYLWPSAAESFVVSHVELIGRPLALLLTLETDSSEEAAERQLPFLLSARTKFANLAVKGDAGGEPRWW